MCSLDHSRDQNANQFESSINNTGFRSRRRVWELRASRVCLPSVPVQEGEHSITVEGLALFCVVYFFPPKWFYSRNAWNILSLSSGQQIRFRELWEWQLFQPLVLAGHKEWTAPTQVPTATVSDIHHRECQRHEANTRRSQAIVPNKL